VLRSTFGSGCDHVVVWFWRFWKMYLLSSVSVTLQGHDKLESITPIGTLVSSGGSTGTSSAWNISKMSSSSGCAGRILIRRISRDASSSGQYSKVPSSLASVILSILATCYCKWRLSGFQKMENAEENIISIDLLVLTGTEC